MRAFRPMPWRAPRAADADGFVEVLDAPTGFMLIARSGVRADGGGLSRTALHARRRAGEPPPQPGRTTASSMCMAEPDNGRYLSEDYAFCRRWQAIGGKVFVDARSRLAHQGLRTYTGDFGRALARR